MQWAAIRVCHMKSFMVPGTSLQSGPAMSVYCTFSTLMHWWRRCVSSAGMRVRHLQCLLYCGLVNPTVKPAFVRFTTCRMHVKVKSVENKSSVLEGALQTWLLMWYP